MVGGLGLMLVLTSKLRIPEAVLIGIAAGFPFTDAARTFAPQLAGDFGRPRDVTGTAVRATSALAAPATAPPPA
jgi:hypothetical protein